MTAGRIVAEAMTWLGVPYRHQGRSRVGCDCLGLVVGVWEAVGGTRPDVPRDYSLDWAETAGGDPMLEAARRHLVEATREPEAGDLLLFRWRPDLAAKHCAIALPGRRIIHAYEGRGVLVSPLGSHWRRRIAGVFVFPELS